MTYRDPAHAVSQSGATINQVYLPRDQQTVGVNVEDLEDFKESAREEFAQFSGGGFFVAGGFWLGVERAATVPNFWTDLLFWICVISVLCGGIVALAGLRQLHRRQGRITRIIDGARQSRGTP